MTEKTNIPGQQVFQELIPELGYDSITVSPTHEMFAREFVLGGNNGTAAYMKANPGTTERSARANACRLLKSEKIQARIAEIRAELERRYAANAAAVVRSLSMGMSVDRRQFVDDDGQPLEIQDLPPEAAAITDIQIVLDRHGKKHALPVVPERHRCAVELGKILGLTKDRFDPSGSAGHNINIYIPDNGRDQAELDQIRMDALREKIRQIKSDSHEP